MTVQNGLLRLKHLRRDIETLRARQAYLAEKIEQKWPDLADRPAETYEGAEIRALDTALDALESEWDTAARMRRNVEVVELRYRNLEIQDVEEIDPHAAPVWRTADDEPWRGLRPLNPA